MMGNYISREAAIEAVKHAWAKGLEPSQYIEILPDADVAPVVHGKWGDNGIAGSILVKCSVCGYDCGANSFSYCPNCGARMRQAKMDGGNEGE